jgi:hypothetical protein
MRKLSLIAAAMLVGSVLAIGAADAQQPRRGAAAMEGPAHPCRTVAMAFDQALRDRIGPAVGNGGQFPGATQMRNQGMEACQAGRVQEGRAQIEQATSSLGM